MITIACRVCNTQMHVPDDQAGQMEKCPACDRLNDIPAPVEDHRKVERAFFDTSLQLQVRQADLLEKIRYELRWLSLWSKLVIGIIAISYLTGFLLWLFAK